MLSKKESDLVRLRNMPRKQKNLMRSSVRSHAHLEIFCIPHRVGERECHETAEIRGFPQTHHQERVLVSKIARDAVLIKRGGLYGSHHSPRLGGGGLAPEVVRACVGERWALSGEVAPGLLETGRSR